MSSFSEGAGRYGAIAAGLLLGTAAKYGIEISDGVMPKWATLLADALMLGMLGLIATVAVDLLAITDQNARMFLAAVVGLLSARLVKIVRDRALNRAENLTDDLIGKPRVSIRSLYERPPSQELPDDMKDRLDKLS